MARETSVACSQCSVRWYMSHRKVSSREPENISPHVTHLARVTLARLLPVSIGNNNGDSDVLQVRLATPLTPAPPRRTIAAARVSPYAGTDTNHT